RRAVPRHQDLLTARAAVRARRRRAPPQLPGSEGGEDPRGGDHRGRVDGVGHRGRDELRHVGRANDPLLHLLFDVRLPARRRPHRAQILASGTSVRNAVIAQQFLLDEHDVAADVWSAPSYKLLREDALSVERWNRLHPTEPARTPYVTEQLGSTEGPIVAVTD